MEHHRPRFHIRPRRGLVNDPNGPILIDGVWHLYFQYRQPIDDNPFVLWGHATSDDLVRWRLHRAALVPDPVAEDHGGCWSGNTVAHDGVVTAFYSGFRPDHPYQTALAADSLDGGTTFGPPRVAVPDPDDAQRVRTLRDPFVWRQHDAWWMVVGTGDLDEVASARLHRSADLGTWEHVGSLAELPRGAVDGLETGAMWECPQVLSIDGEDVLLVCPWAEGEWFRTVLSVRGATVGGEAGPLTLRPVDAGRSFYAASVVRDSPFGPLVWGWLIEERNDDAIREAGWSGTISLPRTVRLGADGGLLTAPVPAVDDLREEEVPTDGQIGAQTELRLRGRGRVVLAFSATESLVIEVGADEVLLDRSAASEDPRSETDPVRIAAAFGGADPEVRVFLDGSVVEAFTSGGRSGTTHVYPAAPPPWRLLDDGLDVTAWRLAAG